MVGLDVGLLVVGGGVGAALVGPNVGPRRVPRGVGDVVVGVEDGDCVQAPQSSAQLAKTSASPQTFELSPPLMISVLMLVTHTGWFSHDLGGVCRDKAALTVRHDTAEHDTTVAATHVL